MEQPEEDVTLEGVFGDTSAFQSERLVDLRGSGTLTITAKGVRVQGSLDPRSQRAATYGLAIVVGAGVLAVALSVAPVLGPIGFVATLGGAYGVNRWRFAARPVDRLYRWSEVTDVSLSNGALLFRVTTPSKGLVRFALPGRDIVALRSYAQRIKRGANRS